MDIRAPSDLLPAIRDLVPGRSLPPGAALAAFQSGSATGEPVSVYGMRKATDGPWSYVVADGEGRVIAEGALPLCEGCHAEAPADHVFVSRRAGNDRPEGDVAP
jgi:hypothetical protein